jgi:uncharacterized protein
MYRYERPRRERRLLKTASYVISALLLLTIGYYVGGMNETETVYYNKTKSVSTVTYVPYNIPNESYSNVSYASVVIPAVDDEGNGVTTLLTVQIIPGQGRVLANIDKLLFWTDTQNSIRTSSKVASNITGIDLSGYDIIYTIRTNATAVEGPSAGTALTIATIAALEKRTINPKVMITGAINHDGTIGPVGQILSKALTAKEAGADIFLVPLLQAQEVTYETTRYCEQIGPAQICTTERVPTKINISEESGINVVEVENIQGALEYFFPED